MPKHDNRYEFLRKLGVGFDGLFKVVDGLGSEYFSEDYPPYNIVKTDEKTYVVQVSMAGYQQDDVGVSLNGSELIVKAKSPAKKPEDLDDVFYHKGIKDGDTYLKFLVAGHLKLSMAEWSGSVLYVTLEERMEPETIDNIEIHNKDDIELYIPKAKVKTDRKGRARLNRRRMGFKKLKYDSAGRVIGAIDEDTQEIDTSVADIKIPDEYVAAGNPEDIREAPLEQSVSIEKSQISEIQNPAGTPDVVVTLPVAVPAIVEVATVKDVGNKVVVDVVDATIEVSDNTDLSIVKLPDTETDVVVSVPKKLSKKASVDLPTVVAEVLKKEEIKVDKPAPKSLNNPVTVLVNKSEIDKPTVEVVVPKVIPQIVEAVANSKTKEIELVPSSDDIPENAKLFPVVTPENQPDIVVAINPVEKDNLKDIGIVVESVVEKAVLQSDVKVETTGIKKIDENKLKEATEKVSEKLVKVAKEPATLVVDEVEVTLAAEESPAIVSVSLDPKPDKPLAVIVKDATVEVPDDTILEVIKTPENKSDVVVAVPDDVVEAFENTRSDVIESIGKALEINDALPDKPEKVVSNVANVVLVPKKDEPLVELSMPTVIEQVVKADVEVVNDVIEVELTNTVNDIPEKAELLPVVTSSGNPDVVVAVEVVPKISPEVLVEKIEKAVSNTISEVVVTPSAEIDYEELILASAKEAETVEKADEIELEVAALETLKEEPTVSVVLPKTNSQILEVAVDPEETTPEKLALVVSDATIEVSDNVDLEVVKTPINKSDVVVAIPTEVKVILDNSDVDIVDALTEAVAEADAAPELPSEDVITETVTEIVNQDTIEPTIEVTVPEKVTSVVELIVDSEPTLKDVPAIAIVDTSEEIPEDATLVPVITAEDEPDVVVAVQPAVEKELKDSGIPIEVAVDAVEKVIINNKTEVTTVTPVDPVTVSDASENLDVINLIKEVAIEPTVTVVKPDSISSNQPTVIVKDLTGVETPLVLEASVDITEEIPVVTVKDATIEVPNEVELIPIKTEEGKPDVVVAVAPEDKVELEEAQIDLPEILAEVVEAPEELVLDDGEAPAIETLVMDDISVTVPNMIPQVVEVVVEPSTNAIIVNPAVVETVDIPVEETIELVPVVTPSGEPDAVAVIENNTAIETEVVIDVVEKALEEVAAGVIIPENVVVDEKELEVASEAVVEETVEVVEKPAPATPKIVVVRK